MYMHREWRADEQPMVQSSRAFSRGSPLAQCPAYLRRALLAANGIECIDEPEDYRANDCLANTQTGETSSAIPPDKRLAGS